MSAGIKLFEPDRHEAVADVAWDEGRAKSEIAEIAKSAANARLSSGYWPGEDVAGDDTFPDALFLGAAGIIWAARALGARGYDIDLSGFDRPELAWDVGLRERYEAYFKGYGVPVSQSFLFGPVGTLILEWKLNGDAATLDCLDTLIGDNKIHPWMENLWGAPSTMLAAGHLFDATGEERFAEHVRCGAEYLWDRLEDCEEMDCRVWDILLYGKAMKLTGAGHGFVGNVFPVIRNLALFDEADQKKWMDLVYNTVTTSALAQDGLVNWPPVVDKAPQLPDKILVHQCHGAPGFVIGLISLFGLGRSDFDDLLLGAGELIWHAGPLKKYPCICHGTAGNGYAFLKLWKATGDEKWLARARAFAMSAVAQRTARLEAGEASRSSLWEGDMGLAMYLADCIEEKSEFPSLDYF